MWHVKFNVKTEWALWHWWASLSWVQPQRTDCEYWVQQNSPAMPAWPWAQTLSVFTNGEPAIGLYIMQCPYSQVCHSKYIFAKHNIPLLTRPPYSSDLAPCDFVFPQLKKTIKGHWFYKVEEIQDQAMRQMRVVAKKVPTWGAFVFGRNTGMSEYNHNGTALKEIKPTSQQFYSFIKKLQSWNFLNNHHIFQFITQKRLTGYDFV